MLKSLPPASNPDCGLSHLTVHSELCARERDPVLRAVSLVRNKAWQFRRDLLGKGNRPRFRALLGFIRQDGRHNADQRAIGAVGANGISLRSMRWSVHGFWRQEAQRAVRLPELPISRYLYEPRYHAFRQELKLPIQFANFEVKSTLRKKEPAHSSARAGSNKPATSLTKGGKKGLPARRQMDKRGVRVACQLLLLVDTEIVQLWVLQFTRLRRGQTPARCRIQVSPCRIIARPSPRMTKYRAHNLGR